VPRVSVDLTTLPPALAEFWTERHLCSLTTLRADGRPHVVPVGVVLDPDQGCAWVITSRTSRKVAHLSEPGEHPVAACQVDGRRWSTLEGSAEVRSDEASVARAVERYASRYRQPRPNPERVAIRITPTRLLAGADLRAR
jgi:PPOX class probable F420-dependent enzyme